MDYTAYHETETEVNEAMCYEAASAEGYTMAEADECESGRLMCGGCPWRK